MTTTANAPETTGVLQLVRAEISVRDFHRWMGTRRLQDPDHAMHCLLTECFGELAPRPFRLMATRGAAAACLYGYGAADAGDLRDAAATFAEPLQSRIIPADGIQSKPMPSEFPAGKRLGFDLRIRPVIRKARGSGREEAEVDAFQAIAETFPPKRMALTREQVYAHWLADRLGKRGAALDQDTVRLAAFQRSRAHRKLHRRHIEGPDAVMQGVLTVADPAAFADALRLGIGRHRAYGYGMLLLRPTRR